MHAKQPHTVSLMFVVFDQEVHTRIEDIHSDRMRPFTLQNSPGQWNDSLFYFHVKLLQITSHVGRGCGVEDTVLVTLGSVGSLFKV